MVSHLYILSVKLVSLKYALPNKTVCLTLRTIRQEEIDMRW